MHRSSSESNSGHNSDESEEKSPTRFLLENSTRNFSTQICNSKSTSTESEPWEIRPSYVELKLLPFYQSAAEEFQKFNVNANVNYKKQDSQISVSVESEYGSVSDEVFQQQSSIESDKDIMTDSDMASISDAVTPVEIGTKRPFAEGFLEGEGNYDRKRNKQTDQQMTLTNFCHDPTCVCKEIPSYHSNKRQEAEKNDNDPNQPSTSKFINLSKSTTTPKIEDNLNLKNFFEEVFKQMKIDCDRKCDHQHEKHYCWDVQTSS